MEPYQIAIIVILVFAAIALIVTLFRLAFQSKTHNIITLIFSFILVLIFYILIFNILDNFINKMVFVDPKMLIFDYVWYILFIIFILLLLASLVKTIKDKNIRDSMLLYAFGVLVVLLTITVLYYIYKDVDNMGKYLFIMTVYVLIVTVIVILANKVIPNIMRYLIIIYAFGIVIYIACILAWIVNLIIDIKNNPKQIETFFSNLNPFKKMNAGSFNNFLFRLF